MAFLKVMLNSMRIPMKRKMMETLELYSSMISSRSDLIDLKIFLQDIMDETEEEYIKKYNL